MITIPSTINSQQNSFVSALGEVATDSRLNNIIENYISVQNSPNRLVWENDLTNKSADVIKDFLKKTVAAQSYHKMFSNGERFKKLGIDLAASSKCKAPLSSLQHLNRVSKDYLTRIKEKTQNLTLQEKILLGKVVDVKLHFRHQSNSNLANSTGTLNIMSLNKLQTEEVCTAKNTFLNDIQYLSNQDFVFFGVEFSGDINQLPLNTLHATVDFGANAYIVNEQFPYGYLTLTDHMYNRIPPVKMQEHKDFINQFSDVKSDVYRNVHGDKGVDDVPIFNTKDMKLGLGLHLIDFLRNTQDEEFKKFALNKNLDNEGLDKILNFVFQPEFHVPRMVSTNNFKKVKLREVSAIHAVKASNFEALSAHIQNKDMACKAMGFAIENAKRDVVSFLFSIFDFTSEDIIKMSTGSKDTEFSLSDNHADEKIMKDFFDRGLIDPNKPFKKCNAGSTMLDNAIKYNKKEMINILLEHGAIRGKY